MTSEELDAVADAVLARAIASGRLPAQPRPETLTMIAEFIRPALSRSGTSNKCGPQRNTMLKAAEQQEASTNAARRST